MLPRCAVAEPKIFEVTVAVAAEAESLPMLHAYLAATAAPLSRTLRSQMLLLGPAARNAADRARRAADLVLAEALQQQSMVAQLFTRQHLLCERASGAVRHSDNFRMVAGRLWHAAGQGAVKTCADAAAASPGAPLLLRVVLLTSSTDWMHDEASSVPTAVAACDMFCGKLRLALRPTHGATVSLEFAVVGAGADAAAVVLPLPGQTLAVGRMADGGACVCPQPQPARAVQVATLQSHQCALVQDDAARQTTALALGIARVLAHVDGGASLDQALASAGVPAGLFSPTQCDRAELLTRLTEARVVVNVLAGFPAALFGAAFDPAEVLAHALAGAGDAPVAVVPWESPARLLQALGSAASAPARADLLLGAPTPHALERNTACAPAFASQLAATLSNARSAAFADAVVGAANLDSADTPIAREQLLHVCLHSPGRLLHADAAVGALCAALSKEYSPL